MWLAGVIDGEGSLCVCKRKISKNHNKRGFNFMPVLRVGNMNKEFLEQVKRFIGSGNICYQKKHIYWQYTLNSNGLRWLLPQLISMLIVKKKQAILMIKVLKLIQENPCLNISKLEILCRKMRKLNS